MKAVLKLPVMLVLLVTVFSDSSMSVLAEGKDAVSDDTEVTRIFLVENGQQKELSKEEYNLLLRQNEQKLQSIESQKNSLKSEIFNPQVSKNENNNTITPFALQDYSYYLESGRAFGVYNYNLTRRISVAVYNETSNEVTRTITFSASQGYSANVSFSTSYGEDAFSASTSLGASWSKTITNSDSISQRIPPKRYSWMEFTPYMDNSWGTMHEEVWNFDGFSNVNLVNKTYFLDLYAARPGNAGLPDGIYTVKEGSTPPA
ncbi:hypothetical protein [Paenibacillus physcomitrellae]|uniref:Uncharacterized protein n=1 Tax=Paenibacillus physcomitrellae TaxID=1619311 RepID=A0ABQ1H115_9BACL|nr:hypothetical protein [Paenibacillus physcomitrellae]GGA53486.1 hypothetical protein GCM10010917_43320 [Paenibacillus physcomitrellae]